MTPGMQVQLTESRDRLPLDGARWNALVERNATRTAFQTFEWFDAWWSAFGPNHHLFLLTIHDAGSIVGIVPLMRVHGPFGLRQLEFVGTPNADYQDLVLPEPSNEAINAICAFLIESRSRWDMLVMRNLPVDSPTVRLLTEACRRFGLRVMDLERQPCPALLIRGHDHEIRPLLDRYSIRRASRRLASRGPVQYRNIDSVSEIDRMLPIFFDQHVRRWRNTEAPSPFTDPVYRRWYRELAHAAHRAGWLHFSVVECGDHPAAFHFGFRHGDVLSWYKPSYNLDFARESPGMTLIANLIQDATQRGLRELDFAGGLEPFKSRFSNVQREFLNLRIFSRPMLGAAFIFSSKLRQRAVRLLRSRRTARAKLPAET